MPAIEYTVRWLSADDATAIAALEAKVHEPRHQAGEHLIWTQLAETEVDGRNLSLGLYCDSRLVGFGLAFVMRKRREVASFFDAPLPAGLDPDEQTIYIADYVVHPEHRSATSLLSSRFLKIIRARHDLTDLPLDAFSTKEYASRWQARRKFLSSLGWELASRHPFHDTALDMTMYWLYFERQAHPVETKPARSSGTRLRRRWPTRYAAAVTVRCIDSTAGWDWLQPWWNPLLQITSEAAFFQSAEYLRAWYAHVGIMDELRIIVALRNGVPVAIAPMRIISSHRLGRRRKYLTFMGDPPEVTRGTLLGDPHDEPAAAAIANYILWSLGEWDYIHLEAQRPDDLLSRTLTEKMRSAGLLVQDTEDDPEPVIETDVSWEGYLEERPELQLAVQRGLERLNSLGPVRFELMPSTAAGPSLELYRKLEQEAPDSELGCGVTASSPHVSFHRQVANSYGTVLGMRFGFLRVGDEIVAGILGYEWNRQFQVVHFTQRESYLDCGTGTVLCAQLIEHLIRGRDCREVSLLSDEIPDRLGWANVVRPAVTLSAHRRSIFGRVSHGATRLVSLKLAHLIAWFRRRGRTAAELRSATASESR